MLLSEFCEKYKTDMKFIYLARKGFREYCNAQEGVTCKETECRYLNEEDCFVAYCKDNERQLKINNHNNVTQVI